jgi:biotin synthase-related radical SAM superfamily protein
LENAISKIKVQPANKTIPVTAANNKPPVEEWTSEQVATWLIELGFDQDLANNFKGKKIRAER